MPAPSTGRPRPGSCWNWGSGRVKSHRKTPSAAVPRPAAAGSPSPQTRGREPLGGRWGPGETGSSGRPHQRPLLWGVCVGRRHGAPVLAEPTGPWLPSSLRCTPGDPSRPLRPEVTGKAARVAGGDRARPGGQGPSPPSPRHAAGSTGVVSACPDRRGPGRRAARRRFVPRFPSLGSEVTIGVISLQNDSCHDNPSKFSFSETDVSFS